MPAEGGKRAAAAPKLGAAAAVAKVVISEAAERRHKASLSPASPPEPSAFSTYSSAPSIAGRHRPSGHQSCGPLARLPPLARAQSRLRIVTLAVRGRRSAAPACGLRVRAGALHARSA
jgi:hypothetical protein